MLRAEHLRVARLATKDESRYSLSSIHITPEVVEVTDSYLLLRVEHAAVDPETLPAIEGVTLGTFEEFCLPAVDALAIAKAIPKVRHHGPEVFALAQIGTESNSNGTAVFGVTDGSSTQVLRPKKADGRFPDVSQVIPRVEDRPHVITFNPRLMAKLCLQISDLLGDQTLQSVTLRISDHESAIRLDAKNDAGEAIVAVLMPMKL